MLAEVHSVTRPRSLSITTSSKPHCSLSANGPDIVSQEMVLRRGSGEAAWRPFRARKTKTSRCPEGCGVNDQVPLEMLFIALPVNPTVFRTR